MKVAMFEESKFNNKKIQKEINYFVYGMHNNIELFFKRIQNTNLFSLYQYMIERRNNVIAINKQLAKQYNIVNQKSVENEINRMDSLILWLSHKVG